MSNTKTANTVSAVSIAVNTFLCAIKLAAGLLAHSSALISDAVHSLSDVISTFAVIAGVNLSARAPDKSHQYGHERIESIFSIILAIMLFATGAGIGFAGIRSIVTAQYRSLAIPGIMSLAAAALSIATKEWMYHYTMRAANKINSTALRADAWHHRSDAFSSIGSFAGILGARLGFPVCDPLASVIICVFIIKAAWEIFSEAMNQLVDRSADEKTCADLLSLIRSQDGVITVDSIKTRLFGTKMYVDVEIGCDGDWSLYRSHSVAEQVHNRIEREFPNVKHCMVHVNPKSV